ncbi:MAG: C39 family peptidase [Elusimicrobia bacterium]|nr:C39 family peptidase [Elusimicrobiota bacterium]
MARGRALRLGPLTPSLGSYPAFSAPGPSLSPALGVSAVPLSAPWSAWAAPAPLPEARSAALPAAAGLEAAVESVAAAPEKGGLDARASLDRLFTGDPGKAGADVGSPEPSLPPDYLPVPVTTQETSYSCGAAAVLSLLRYWRSYAGDEASLYPLLGTRPQDGTPPENMVMGLGHFGLDAAMQEGMSLADLRSSLRAGKTVILAMQAWRDAPGGSWADTWDAGHYVVLNGMDERYAYFMDPSTEERYAYVPLDELLERWHDYEDRDGQVRRYLRLGIVVSGRSALPRPEEPPADPDRMELRRPVGPWSRH